MSDEIYKSIPVRQLEFIREQAKKIIAGRVNYNTSVEYYLKEVITAQTDNALQIKILIDNLLKNPSL